jgi:hypothetical protein
MSGAHRLLAALRFRFDWTLTVAMLAVAALGLVNLWSAVRERQFQLFARQVSWLAIGMVLFLGAASFDYRGSARIGYMLYGGGVALLLAVLLGASWRRRAPLVRPGGLPPAALRADEGAAHRGASPSTSTTPRRWRAARCDTCWCRWAGARPSCSSPASPISAPR